MLNFLLLLSFIVPFPFWFLLIVFPRRQFTRNMFSSAWGHVGFIILGAMYLFLLVGAIIAGISAGTGLNLSGFTTANGLAAMFATPAAALVAWIHLVAMDLAGAFYIYSQADKLKMPNWALSLNLLATLVLGPLGMFIFAMGRLLTAMRQPRTARADLLTADRIGYE